MLDDDQRVLAGQRHEELGGALGFVVQRNAAFAAGGGGTAAQSSGPSAGYAGRLRAYLKPKLTFTGEIRSSAPAVVRVRVAPDGTIIGRRIVQSSGNRAWDEAVLRALDKTETLPRDTDGRVPPALIIGFRPKD